ncbi:MAG: CBS domain-containing protein, partial [Gammaproteobacteria bacterium]|nr:CBS domain-containing protein [Gammaproteobacteria bacterium]NIX10610.1 CBS domain-containing protein [Gammaproteobacteria bacterium]
MAIAATLQIAADCSASDYIVVLLPDSGSKYLSKIYSDVWMKEHQYLDPPVQLNIREILAEKATDTKELIAVPSEATIGQAIELMRGHGISQVPVIAEGRCLGRLDEARLLQLLLTNSEAWHHNVVEFMGEPYPEISEETPLAELAELLGGPEQAVMVRGSDSGLSILTKSDLIFTLFKAEKAGIGG